MPSRCVVCCSAAEDITADEAFFLVSVKTEPFLIQAIKPTVLIGTSGVGQTFTQDVVETMAELNEVYIFRIDFNEKERSILCIHFV